MTYLLTHPLEVWQRLVQHLALTGVALAIALAIALPLGVVAHKVRAATGPVFGILGAIYTIPSLALFALLIPFEGLGFLTAITALAAYAQMILVRNIAAGLAAVPAAQTDAARGLGMSSRQQLLRVELPQALPVILGGVRIATVSIVGMANVAAWINAGGLGTLLFAGIQQDDPQRIFAGAFASALLAILADVLLRGLERRASA